MPGPVGNNGGQDVVDRIYSRFVELPDLYVSSKK